jgi:hypothetical protein
MLAKLIRRGCAARPPVIAEIFVLSEDKITPRTVAPGPSCVYEKVIIIIIEKKKNSKIHLNIPCLITR